MKGFPWVYFLMSILLKGKVFRVNHFQLQLGYCKCADDSLTNVWLKLNLDLIWNLKDQSLKKWGEAEKYPRRFFCYSSFCCFWHFLCSFLALKDGKHWHRDGQFEIEMDKRVPLFCHLQSCTLLALFKLCLSLFHSREWKSERVEEWSLFHSLV